MTKIHITPKGPKPCRANVRNCKYGAHFENMSEATAAFETQMNKDYGKVSTLTKSEPNETLLLLEEYGEDEHTFYPDSLHEDVQEVLKDVRYFNPEHKGYLLVAKSSSPYGSIGNGGKTGYRVVGDLSKEVAGLNGLEALEKDSDNQLHIKTSNHDFSQDILVYKLNQSEYDKFESGLEWSEMHELFGELKKTPLTFKKG